MCGIVGAILSRGLSTEQVAQANRDLDTVFQFSFERGRDGWGYRTVQSGVVRRHRVVTPQTLNEWPDGLEYFNPVHDEGIMIGNLRAEPTTEFVKEKHEYDQQPYALGNWSIVHNGTIANDKYLRTNLLRTSIDSAAIAELLDKLDEDSPPASAFEKAVSVLKGSFAILATHDDEPDVMFVAANYRPVWYALMGYGVLFASSRDYFPRGALPQMVEPYTASVFHSNGQFKVLRRLRGPTNKRALVVCSGGLDSVVSAAWAKAEGYDITLLHFQYGSRAEGPEARAVHAAAEALHAPLTLFPLPVYQPQDSPLLRADSSIAGGEAGAEFAHEWVPARNLVMLSIAIALAEAQGFDNVILGNNLEEAGAYPDNEPEFISRLNDLLPFAVADGKHIRIIMPVGNLMKHEIVALGHKLGAPLDKTWSCYRAGHEHCGTCGPCYMRRTAFEINGLPEVIHYANERTNS